MALTQEQLDQFRRDGFIIVEGIFDRGEVEEANLEMEKIFYGSTFEEYMARVDATGKAEPVEPRATSGTPHYGETDHGRAQFPTGVKALDRLIENEDYLDMYTQVLGTQDIRYCNGHLFLRSGPTDKRHADNPWQGYHIDNDTNSFFPPHPDLDVYNYVNSCIYLHDVEEDAAPMQLIPGSHLQIGDLLPRLIEDGNWPGRGGIEDIRRIPELAEPVSATGTAGSVRFNSSYGVHAAIPFQNKRKQRGYWTLSLCRGDTSGWTKMSNVWRDRQYAIPFFTETTPRARSIFGWPPPGDPYYSAQTLRALEHWFPGIALEPYRAAAAAA